MLIHFFQSNDLSLLIGMGYCLMGFETRKDYHQGHIPHTSCMNSRVYYPVGAYFVSGHMQSQEDATVFVNVSQQLVS